MDKCNHVWRARELTVRVTTKSLSVLYRKRPVMVCESCGLTSPMKHYLEDRRQAGKYKQCG